MRSGRHKRGGGAFLDGEPLGAVRPKDEIELLQFEATVTDLVADRIEAFRGIAERIRVMGSLALSLCHLAAGRVDAVCSLKPARSVDIAAAQLLIRECGLAVDLPESPPFERAPLDLEGRSRIVAAGTPDACRRLADAPPALKPVRIGCSGWNYARPGASVVYPKGAPARRWLEHYATLFDTVEVNATFYRLPTQLRRRRLGGADPVRASSSRSRRAAI